MWTSRLRYTNARIGSALPSTRDRLAIASPMRRQLRHRPPSIGRHASKRSKTSNLKRLAQWRGYSVEFCSWLRDQNLIGLWKGSIAFPVHDDAGRVIGCHFRTKTGDWFFTEGCAVRALIIGNLADAAQVDVFESQWDAFAVCDKLRLHETDGVAVIITRGAGNGGLIGGLIPPKAEVFAWKQNDEEKRGKRAGDEWLKTVVRSATAIVRCVITPAQFKDPNEWTVKGRRHF